MFKSLLVLAMALGLLAGCNNGINVHPINHTAPMVNAVLVVDPVPDEPLVAMIRQQILFDFDSSKLDIMGLNIVDAVAAELEAYPDTVLALKGHTDKYGSNEYNQALSMRRSIAVENALVEAGVNPENIASVEGFGKSQLLKNVTNRENRRVLILSVGE